MWCHPSWCHIVIVHNERPIMNAYTNCTYRLCCTDMILLLAQQQLMKRVCMHVDLMNNSWDSAEKVPECWQVNIITASWIPSVYIAWCVPAQPRFIHDTAIMGTPHMSFSVLCTNPQILAIVDRMYITIVVVQNGFFSQKFYPFNLHLRGIACFVGDLFWCYQHVPDDKINLIIIIIIITGNEYYDAGCGLKVLFTCSLSHSHWDCLECVPMTSLPCEYHWSFPTDYVSAPTTLCLRLCEITQEKLETVSQPSFMCACLWAHDGGLLLCTILCSTPPPHLLARKQEIRFGQKYVSKVKSVEMCPPQWLSSAICPHLSTF